MSYVAQTSTLTIGNSTSTTVNIDSANTLNLGKTDGTGTVNIRGLDLLITSATSQFTSFTAGANNGPGYTTATQCFYLLPFTTSQNILVQWGYVPDSAVTVRTFNRSFASTPYLYCTQYDNGDNISPIVIKSVSSTNFEVDPEFNIPDKSSFNWLAIGVANK